MSQAKFSVMPDIAIGGTGWSEKVPYYTSFNHGKAVPILAVRMMPGDHMSLKLHSLINMATPIAPIKGTIKCTAHAFFIPQRLVYDKTPEFFGENRESAGPVDPDDYLLPAAKYGVDADSTAAVGSVAHYLGKPLAKLESGSAAYMSSAEAPMVSVLKERCYWLVINEYFRKKQVDAPILIYTDGTGRIAQGPGVGNSKTWSSDCWTVRKMEDYFVSSTISPQYSLTPVLLPLGETAPLIARDIYQLDPDDDGYALKLDSIDPDTKLSTLDTINTLAVDGIVGHNRSVMAYGSGAPEGQDGVINAINLYADLSKATAANINELRTAFAIQRYLERDNYACTYPEHIKAHFGVTAPMGLLQKPELLGSASWLINVNQVISLADAANNTSTKLGQPGANSTTFNSSFLFRKSFVEDGYLMVIIETKHVRSYSQGILRDDLKRSKWELYSPEMAHLGDQATKRFEIYAQKGVNKTGVTGDSTFGFTGHWNEYRYIKPLCTGLLDPQAPSSLSFWDLTDSFDKDVAFDSTFLEEDRTNIARALVTGLTGPDYIADFVFDIKWVRLMPISQIPGLIDHVGAR